MEVQLHMALRRFALMGCLGDVSLLLQVDEETVKRVG